MLPSSTPLPTDNIKPGRKPRSQANAGDPDTNIGTTRILRVLAEFACEPYEFGVTEIAERLDMTKNMAFRALTTLVDQGYLVRTASGRRYELGYRVVELASPYTAEPDLRSLAAPFMLRMQQVTGETAILGLFGKDSVVVIDGIEAPHAIGSRVPIGVPYPLHVSPVSRAILAHLSDAEITEYVATHSPLLRLTDTTIVDPQQLNAEIALIRSRGYALGYGDATPSKISVAFAILDADDKPWGGIAVGGPGARFSTERLDAVLPELQQIASELNARSRFFSAAGNRSMFF